MADEFDDARRFIHWLKMNRAESIEVPTKTGPIKITFRQPNEKEIRNEQIATMQEMAPMDRAKLENLDDAQKDEYLKRQSEENERKTYWSA